METHTHSRTLTPSPTNRAETLRRLAADTHPALAHAMRRRAAELEFQEWLELVSEGADIPQAA